MQTFLFLFWDPLTNKHGFSLVFLREVGALSHAVHIPLQDIPAHLIVEGVTEFGLHLGTDRWERGRSVSGEQRVKEGKN